MLARMRNLGMTFHPPNYVYFDRFTANSVVADVGCGFEAELSRHMIVRHGLHAFGVDPTKKHRPYLAALETASGGRFKHLPLALSAINGTLAFHESLQNESGSLLSEHTNIRRDDITTYQVESVTLTELRTRLGRESVDLLKLDLEGAEYALFENVKESDLTPFQQIFLECHHHCTDHPIEETKNLVARIVAMDFKVFTLDQHNFLFFR